MNIKEGVMKFFRFLKEDTWQSWIVSLILVVVGIKFVIFPLLSLATGTPLPLVVVESCSMYHETSFDAWWEKNAAWYQARQISKQDFKSFSLKGGLNKGDIVLVWGHTKPKLGDIIIFNAGTRYPVIHRLVTLDPRSTKGDHNADYLLGDLEESINDEQVLGKAVGKVPLIGWIKLVFYELARPPQERGLCK